MPDYRNLYFTLFRRIAHITEQLIAVQQELEALHLAQEEECLIPYPPVPACPPDD